MTNVPDPLVATGLAVIGVHRLLFAEMIDEKREAQREAQQADPAGAGYIPRYIPIDARTEGLVMLAIGGAMLLFTFGRELL